MLFAAAGVVVFLLVRAAVPRLVVARLHDHHAARHRAVRASSPRAAVSSRTCAGYTIAGAPRHPAADVGRGHADALQRRRRADAPRRTSRASGSCTRRSSTRSRSTRSSPTATRSRFRPPAPPPPLSPRRPARGRPRRVRNDGGDGRSGMALRVGVVGGGQLARMMIAPAVELGIELRVLAEEDGHVGGARRDRGRRLPRCRDTVLAFARDVDVVTFDHEHVPQEVLARARRRRRRRAARARTRCGSRRTSSLMRARLAELGMPQPDWAAVTDAARAAGVPRRARRPRRRQDAARRLRRQGRARRASRRPRPTTGSPRSPRTPAAARCSSEELVDFRRELAQQVARRPSGEVRA